MKTLKIICLLLSLAVSVVAKRIPDIVPKGSKIYCDIPLKYNAIPQLFNNNKYDWKVVTTEAEADFIFKFHLEVIEAHHYRVWCRVFQGTRRLYTTEHVTGWVDGKTFAKLVEESILQ